MNGALFLRPAPAEDFTYRNGVPFVHPGADRELA
jgi:hypothetical protein